MRTLQEAIDRMDNKGGSADSLRKWLEAARIRDWEDITRSSLYDLHDAACEALAPSTARTVFAHAKSLFNRYSDEIELPKGWDKILTSKNVKPMKIYLTESELHRIEAGKGVHTDKQRFVLNVFLICAYTGLRVSDAMALTPENVVDGNLHYVAGKTRKAGAMPLKSGLEQRIAWIAEHPGQSVTLKCYNEAVRRICRDAGITQEVVVLKAGREQRGPKWQFVSSHTARISTASCLSRRGVPVGDICKILQHSGTQMTERYIVRDRVELSGRAMAFFR